MPAFFYNISCLEAVATSNFATILVSMMGGPSGKVSLKF